MYKLVIGWLLTTLGIITLSGVFILYTTKRIELHLDFIPSSFFVSIGYALPFIALILWVVGIFIVVIIKNKGR